MGKQIVYCGSCGGILQERDFARGLAYTQGHRHFCARCRALYVPAPTPTQPVAPETVKKTATRFS